MAVIKLVLIAIFVVILPIGCDQPQRGTNPSRFQHIETIDRHSNLYRDTSTGVVYIRTTEHGNAFNDDIVTWTKL